MYISIRRIMGYVLAFSLTGGILLGCQSGSATSPSSSQTPTPTPSASTQEDIGSPQVPMSGDVGGGSFCTAIDSYCGVAVQGQCVAFVRDFASAVLGSTIPSIGAAHPSAPYAHWIYDDSDHCGPSGMVKIINTGFQTPSPHDIIVFGATATCPTGHVAIVDSAENPSSVIVVDSNWLDVTHPEKGYRHTLTPAQMGSWVVGWFHKDTTIPPPTSDTWSPNGFSVCSDTWFVDGYVKHGPDQVKLNFSQASGRDPYKWPSLLTNITQAPYQSSDHDCIVVFGQCPALPNGHVAYYTCRNGGFAGKGSFYTTDTNPVDINNATPIATLADAMDVTFPPVVQVYTEYWRKVSSADPSTGIIGYYSNKSDGSGTAYPIVGFLELN